MKKETVSYGGITMSRRDEIKADEKVRMGCTYIGPLLAFFGYFETQKVEIDSKSRLMGF